MPLKVKPSYEALLYFIEDKDVIVEICEHFYQKNSSYDFNDDSQPIWHIILDKVNDNRNHHYTNRKSLEYLQYKLSRYKSKHTLYNLLKYLYLEHFEVKRGRNILRIDKIESFQFLQNSIDITPIYSMSISEYIEDYPYRDRIKYIEKSVENISIPLPNRFLSIKSFSDNHFHLGGGNNYNYRLHKMLQEPLFVDVKNTPDNYKIKSFRVNKKHKFIIYATSILEKILLGYIVHNNQEKQSKEEIVKNQIRFRKALKIFSQAIKDYDFHKLDYIENNSEIDDYDKESSIESKENYEDKKSNKEKILLFDIRPKLNRSFFDSLLLNNYYNKLIYKIIKYNINDEIHKADVMLWVLFSDISREHKNDILKDFILVYMSLRNILHSFIIQDQQKGGLEYFSSYSRSSIRRAKQDYELNDTFNSILDKKYTYYIEARIIFKETEEELAYEILKWFKAFLITNIAIKKFNNKIKFMLHYKKDIDRLSKKFYKNQIGHFIPMRYEEYRKNIFQQTQILLNFLKNKRYASYKITLNNNIIKSNFLKKFQKENINTIIKINKKKKYIIINMHELISGIDAASLEYNTPPEVFAPVYSYTKNSPELLGKAFQFSFHAGEDTEDVITSLRTIVESIIFLDLKKGDRIGHALSLGYKYTKSYLEDDIFLISNEKALDNAVFLYFLFCSLYFKEDREKFLNIFRQKIFKLGSKIYTNNYSVNQYINAWLLRRNSPLTINKILAINKELNKQQDSEKDLNKYNIDKIIDSLNDEEYQLFKNLYYYKKEDNASVLRKLNADNYHKFKHLYPYKLFFKYASKDIFKLKSKSENFYTKRYELARNDIDAWKILLLYHFDKNVRKTGEEQIEDKHYSSEIIEIAQDLIMEYIIAKNDIIIEAMPTSNILNSQLESYMEHPIFRFKPVDNLEDYNKYNIRTAPLQVIINTDNPGFQATSYLNELFLINEAGIKLGYNHKDIENYIQEIVELGNLIFTRKAPQE